MGYIHSKSVMIWGRLHGNQHQMTPQSQSKHSVICIKWNDDMTQMAFQKDWNAAIRSLKMKNNAMKTVFHFLFGGVGKWVFIGNNLYNMVLW